MSADDRFDVLSSGLVAGVRARDGLSGLVLLGSASAAGESRRDEWSDHDFFAIIEPGRGPELRADLGWLPDPDRIVLSAREGGVGFVVVYDDGHVFEFALAEPSELADSVAGDASVVVDDDAATTAGVVAAGQAAASGADAFDPDNDARLVLVKLLLGVGRVRRGESLNGGQFVRGAAVTHLLRAIRGRFPAQTADSRDIIDPTRRFEKDYPALAGEIADALASPVEDAARSLFSLTRRVLEPGWTGFPSLAADAVARRLGWPDGQPS